MIRFDANCTFLFKEVDLLERPAAARAAGFDAIELWWPFDVADPDRQDVDELVRAVRSSGVHVVGLNFFAGDLAGPDCGLVSWPGREGEFRAGVEAAVSLGQRVGTCAFNALYGNRLDSSSPAEQSAVARENLAFAARTAADIGATILIEPVSGPKPYPLRTTADILPLLDDLSAQGIPNVKMLLDIFHLETNGDDVPAAIATAGERIGHVQLADSPGRGEPGTGALPVHDYLAQLDASGYGGWVGLEYNPSHGDTATSLTWLPIEDRRETGIDMTGGSIA
jgi:hydroxypyruvate isomerase